MAQQAALLPRRPTPLYGTTDDSDDSWQTREAREGLAALQAAGITTYAPGTPSHEILGRHFPAADAGGPNAPPVTYRQPLPAGLDPFTAAAARVHNAAQPDGGRQEGRLSATLSNFVPQTVDTLVTLPQRAFEASAEDWQHRGDPHWRLRSVGPATETAMWMLGGGGVVPAEANALRAGIKTYRGSPKSFDTAFATHEAIPGADTGHMTGSINAPAAERAAYSADPRSTWANAPAGRDAIYGGLSRPGSEVIPVRPTREIQGSYTPPGGVTETNSGWAARPQVKLDAGKVMPADAALLNAGEATRGYVDAQNASAWHVPVKRSTPADSNSLFIPMRGKATPEQLAELKTATAPHGLPDLVDTGQGITATRFWPPPESIGKSMQRKGGLADAIKGVLPDAAPQRVKVDSNLIDYVPKWQEGLGSGAATREVLSHINASPKLREAFNTSTLIPQNAMDRMTRDQDWMARWGAPREDIQNARRIIGEGPGWVDRLEAALRAGATLPAVAAAFFGGAAEPRPKQ